MVVVCSRSQTCRLTKSRRNWFNYIANAEEIMENEIQKTEAKNRELLDLDHAFGDLKLDVSETAISNAKSNILQPHTPCYC